MTGAGNCYDNSVVESFVRSLKAELILRHSRQTWHKVKFALFEYINGFCAPRRKNSSLGGKSLMAFERRPHNVNT